MNDIQSDRNSQNRTCRFRSINKTGIRVVMEVTSFCNFSCRHCFVEKISETPSLKQINKIVYQLAEIDCKKVILTGGEPLLRNDLEEIIENISKQGILVDLNTNLFLLSEQRLNMLLNSGLNELSVSLYGNEFIHDHFTGNKGSYSQILRNLEILKKEKVPVDIHSGLMVMNINEIESIVQICSSMNMDSLTFFSIIPGPFNQNTNDYYLDKEEILSKISKISENSTIPINTVGFVKPDISECTMCNSVIGINSKLELKPCLLAKSMKAKPIIFENQLDKSIKKLRLEVENKEWIWNCLNN